MENNKESNEYLTMQNTFSAVQRRVCLMGTFSHMA